MLLLSNNHLLLSMKQSSNIDKKHWIFVSQNWHFEIDLYAIVSFCRYSVHCTGVFLGVCANICSSGFAEKGIDSNSMCRGKKIILAPIKLIFISDLTSHVRVYGHERNDLFFGSSYWLSPTTILLCKFFYDSPQAHSIKLLSQTITKKGWHGTASPALANFEEKSLLDENISTIPRRTIASFAKMLSAPVNSDTSSRFTRL